jgi:hypothetical protein
VKSEQFLKQISFFLKHDHAEDKQCQLRQVQRCDIKRVCQHMADLPVAFHLVVHVASNKFISGSLNIAVSNSRLNIVGQ